MPLIRRAENPPSCKSETFSLDIDDDHANEHTDDNEECWHLRTIHQHSLRNDLSEDHIEHRARSKTERGRKTYRTDVADPVAQPSAQNNRRSGSCREHAALMRFIPPATKGTETAMPSGML